MVKITWRNDGERLALTIENNGKGFDSAGAKKLRKLTMPKIKNDSAR